MEESRTGWVYLTCCVNSTARKIDAMTEAGREITYQTFRGHVPDVDRWAVQHGYDRPECRQPGGLKLQHDYAVSFYESTYDGESCYYLRWSGIEFIWVQR